MHIRDSVIPILDTGLHPLQKALLLQNQVQQVSVGEGAWHQSG